jgi:hypothetical protein
MKIFAIAAIVIALYLMYRTACPKSPEKEKSDDLFPKSETDTSDVVGKSRFVLENRSQHQPTPATSAIPENGTKKENTFVPLNEKTGAVIPPEDLDEVFAQPIDIDYPCTRVRDEPEEEAIGESEEDDEDFCLIPGRDAELADGFSYEEMVQAFDGNNAQAAEVLYRLEKTDLFEQLVSGDTGRSARIKALLDRHERENEPEANADDSNEHGNFDIVDFLS